MGSFEFTLLVAVFLVFIGFQQWLRHHRRVLIHRERLAAIDKGIELPPLEQEVRRRSFSIQRVLLFAGIVWISLGSGTFLTLLALDGQTFDMMVGYDPFGNQLWRPTKIRGEFAWIGVALAGIGLAHLVVYQVGKKKEAREGGDQP